jgi:hypothetical protein
MIASIGIVALHNIRPTAPKFQRTDLAAIDGKPNQILLLRQCKQPEQIITVHL